MTIVALRHLGLGPLFTNIRKPAHLKRLRAFCTSRNRRRTDDLWAYDDLTIFAPNDLTTYTILEVPMLPDNIWDELFKFEKLTLELACDGDEHGLSPEQMDMFNDLNNDLNDIIAVLGLAEQK